MRTILCHSRCPADTVHISCSFSFAIRASAHESPLSRSSSLPRSPFILSLSLVWLALWAFEMVMRERFCGCLHPSPSRAGAWGPSVLPIESSDKGAICHLFSSHESLLIFPSQIYVWSKQIEKLDCILSTQADQHLWSQNYGIAASKEGK